MLDLPGNLAKVAGTGKLGVLRHLLARYWPAHSHL
jgi:hypothetical protein